MSWPDFGLTTARPGTDPDRASFTSALEAARDQLTAAGGICPDDPADQPGVIGRAVLATLLPARRPRYSARIVGVTAGQVRDVVTRPKCGATLPRWRSRRLARPGARPRP
jgi:hypothetical protein